MSFAKTIDKGPQVRRPLKWLIHSPPKVGKSHLAAGSSAPFFLDGERGSLEFDVHRRQVDFWGTLLDGLDYLENAQHPYRTVVLDTLDSLERCLMGYVVGNDDKATSITTVGGGFNKGWEQVAEEWHKLTERLDRLQERRGLNLLVLGHSKIERMTDPDTGAEWDRWTLGAHKKTVAVMSGWVDEILFLTRDVRTQGKRDKKGKGGTRLLHTAWSPGRIAGSRRNLPPVIVIPQGPPADAWQVVREAATAAVGGAQTPKPEPDPEPEVGHQEEAPPPKEEDAAPAPGDKGDPTLPDPADIVAELRNLMTWVSAELAKRVDGYLDQAGSREQLDKLLEWSRIKAKKEGSKPPPESEPGPEESGPFDSPAEGRPEDGGPYGPGDEETDEGFAPPE